MRTVSRFHLFIILILGTLPLSANPGDDSNPDQGQQTEKAIHEYKLSEARLDKAYKNRLAATRSESDRKNLIASQKAWLLYCDSVLLVETPKDNDWGSGTAERLNIIKKQLTDERIHILTQEL